ncbi:MAG TPA: DUF3050 domain-containing protein [Candidatus Nanopelagicales bacterium]|nr:DUF3050 domain-containing protein [Candidatus Nanopelagicales bacterium]
MLDSAPPSLAALLRVTPHPLAGQVTGLAARAASHPVFSRLRTAASVRVFMEHHVWAVWDFMSLLKSVQDAAAPVRVPWVPPQDPEAARLVNEIVLGEECDDGPGGAPTSHFEIYLRAMDRAGADTGPIRGFVAALAGGAPFRAALAGARAPAASRAFVEATLEICAGPVHGRVAALTLGREELIPGMFTRAVRELAAERSGSLGDFLWYLERHVEVDGERHGPMTARLFQRVCARDAVTLGESLDVAARVLTLRVALWSAVEDALTAGDGRRAVSAPI